jgi:hypothetical protein
MNIVNDCCLVFSDYFTYTDCTIPPTKPNEDLTDYYNFPDPSDLGGYEAEFQAAMADRLDELVNYNLRGEYFYPGYSYEMWCKPNHPAFSSKAFWSSDNMWIIDYNIIAEAMGWFTLISVGGAGRFVWIDEHEGSDNDPRYHLSFIPGLKNVYYNSCSTINAWFEANKKCLKYSGTLARTNFIDDYNTEFEATEEQTVEEIEEDFQTWASEQSMARSYSIPGNLFQYDFRGYWKNATEAERLITDNEFPYTYDKPNNYTFSSDSIYNGVDGYRGGDWGETNDIITFTPSITNIVMNGYDGLINWFEANKPDVKLYMPEWHYPGLTVDYREVDVNWEVGSWIREYGNGMVTSIGATVGSGAIMKCKLPKCQDDDEATCHKFPYTIDVNFNVTITSPEIEEDPSPWETLENQCHLRVYYNDDDYVDIGLMPTALGPGTAYLEPDSLPTSSVNILAAAEFAPGKLIQLRVCVHKEFVMFSVNQTDHYVPIFKTSRLVGISSNVWGFGTGTITMAEGYTCKVSVQEARLYIGNEESICGFCEDCYPYCPNAKWGAVPLFLKVESSGITDIYDKNATPPVVWTAPVYGDCLNGTHYLRFLDYMPGCMWSVTRCQGTFEADLRHEEDNYYLEVSIGISNCGTMFGGSLVYRHDFGPELPDIINLKDCQCDYIAGVLPIGILDPGPSQNPIFVSASNSDYSNELPLIVNDYYNGYATCQNMHFYCSDCLRNTASWLVSLKIDEYIEDKCKNNYATLNPPLPAPGTTFSEICDPVAGCGTFVGSIYGLYCTVGRGQITIGGHDAEAIVETESCTSASAQILVKDWEYMGSEDGCNAIITLTATRNG